MLHLAVLLVFQAANPPGTAPASVPDPLREWFSQADRVVVGHLTGQEETVPGRRNSEPKSISASLLAVDWTLWGAPEVCELRVCPPTAPRSDQLMGKGREPAVWFLADSRQSSFQSPGPGGGVVLAQEVRLRLAMRETADSTFVQLPTGKLTPPAEVLALHPRPALGGEWEIPLPAFEEWLGKTIAAETPRIVANHVGNFVCQLRLVVGPDGEGTIRDCQPERRFGLGPAGMEALLGVLEREDPFTLPRELGHDRAPCVDWGDVEVRTARGSKHFMLFSQPDSSPEGAAAHRRAMRIWNALPHDGRWRLD